MIVLPLDRVAAQQVAELESLLERKEERVEFDDLLIAAIAIVNGQKLITRDADFARIPNLRMEKY